MGSGQWESGSCEVAVSHSAPSIPALPRLVYLTGAMASGKSTVGPLLADALGTRFVDLDWLVEARTGRTVAELFAVAGERAFRVAEAGALAETTRGEPAVVATGGGTLAAPANLRTARAAGAVVWLRVAPDVLARRLERTDLSARPLLVGPDERPLRGDALLARVRSLLDARTPLYAQADIVVDADGPADVVAREVAEALAAWRCASE